MAKNKETKGTEKIFLLLKNREWKKAYKESLFRYGLNKSEKIRELVIQSHWAWIKNLFEQNDWDNAKAEATKFISFGVKPEEIPDDAAMLFLKLDIPHLLPDEKRIKRVSKNVRQEILNQYMLNDRHLDKLSETWKADADCILDVLRNISAGSSGPDVIEPLRSVPFDSPLVDWVLFARGLFHWYEDKKREIPDSWKRLNPNGIPNKIVSRLLTIQAPFLLDKTTESFDDLYWRLYQRGNTTNTQESFFAYLQNLKTFYEMKQFVENLKDNSSTENILKTLKLYNKIRDYLKQYNPELYDSFRSYLMNRLICSLHDEKMLRDFIQENKPFPYDPNGNLALFTFGMHDQSEMDNRLDILVSYANNYVQDIDLIEGIPLYFRNRYKAFFLMELARLIGMILKKTTRITYGFEKDREKLYGNESVCSDVQRLVGEIRQKLTHIIEKMIEIALHYEHEDIEYLKKYLLVLIAIDKREKCVQIFQKIMRLSPEDVFLGARYVDYLKKIGLGRKAEKYCRKAVRKFPERTEFVMHLLGLTMKRLIWFFKKRNWKQVELALKSLNQVGQKYSEAVPVCFPMTLSVLQALLLRGAGREKEAVSFEKTLGLRSREKKIKYYGVSIIFAQMLDRMDLVDPERTQFFEDAMNGPCNRIIASFFGDFYSFPCMGTTQHWKLQNDDNGRVEDRVSGLVWLYMLRALPLLWKDEEESNRFALGMLQFFVHNKNHKYYELYEVQWKRFLFVQLSKFENNAVLHFAQINLGKSRKKSNKKYRYLWVRDEIYNNPMYRRYRYITDFIDSMNFI